MLSDVMEDMLVAFTRRPYVADEAVNIRHSARHRKPFFFLFNSISIHYKIIMMYVNRNIRIHHDEKAPGYMFLHYYTCR